MASSVTYTDILEAAGHAIGASSNAHLLLWIGLLAMLVEKGVFGPKDVDELIRKLESVAEAEVNSPQEKQQVAILKTLIEKVREMRLPEGTRE